MENEIVSGIAYSKEEANITLINISDKPGIASKIFTPLSNANINVDMIVQTGSENGKNINFTYTVSRKDLKECISIMKKSRTSINYKSIITNAKLAKISIIGFKLFVCLVSIILGNFGIFIFLGSFFLLSSSKLHLPPSGLPSFFIRILSFILELL